ncbi:HET-domain-containing protein, partial [Trametes versicolor FP-101664 SS1]|uniref:HET-domain-containing protein n=1 Tax=Trametes versicolor (strain FP-101664) TaxID=717944 RepID=UPI0004621BBC
YLALSYVWGEPQPHQTTTCNISTYAKRIDVSLLPQTIRDAIAVTHSLGLQYLWTDSLCIMQDSGEDKLHELARMHLVYRYAYLTIIAASAERVSDGFLEDRSPPLDPEDYLTLPIVCPPHSHTPGGSITGPINARGWCLQEFYMSPRALLFTSVTLQFKCQAGRWNIGHSLQTTKNDFWLPDVLFYPDPPALEQGSLDWSMVHRRWGDIVHQYSTRKLGEASDKLVACGALAEAFHRILSSDYLAGLWRDTLLHDLLWRRAPDAMSITDLVRPAEYRAPSWSWASVDGPVSMLPWDYGADATAVAEILRCEVTLKDPELQFGELRGASIVLR